MSFDAVFEILFYVGLVPAFTALVAFFALTWLLPKDVERRYTAGGAFALGVLAGFAMLPSTKSLVPSQFWEWTAYLGPLAALVAGLSQAQGVSRGERVVAWLLTCAVAAWLAVPTWEDLYPPRHMLVPLVALGMFMLSALLEPLAARLPGRLFPWWLACAAGTASLVMMSEVSETFGRLAGLPAAALAACGLAMLVAKRDVDAHSLALPYAVVVGGYAFTGYTYPSPPLHLLLAVPLAPLALWLSTLGPLARLTGKKALVAQAACVLIPLLTLTAIILWRSAISGGNDWQ